MGSYRFLIRTLVFLLLILTGVAFLIPALKPIALASPYLNSFILAVLLFGIAYAFFQFFRLIREGNHLEAHQKFGGHNIIARYDELPSSSLLVPTMKLIDQYKYLSFHHVRLMIDNLANQFEEGRELGRYIMGLLIFLGLLGTFWGLSQTIGAIAQVITDLPTTSHSMENFFNLLKINLKAPLSGMGVAFSSSLFGLSASLILGFVELQVARAQQSFLRLFEEWLLRLTTHGQSLVSSELPSEEALPIPYVQVFWQHIGEHLELLQKTLSQSERTQTDLREELTALTEKMGKFTDQVQVEQNLMRALAEGQVHLQKSVKDMTQQLGTQGLSLDEGTRAHLRNLDLSCKQLLKDTHTGRKDFLQELRQEMRLLGRGLMASTAERTPTAKKA